tara:strand:- start:158 stop:412 length:255 start_codon:yes stop_codon:yes gene_type:complete
MAKYKNKDFGLFRIGKKIHKITKRVAEKYNDFGHYKKSGYKNPDPCYMTAMNNRVYKLTGIVNFAWFDGGGEYDYYLAEGNFWD